jgi:segregation and condensation protein B
MSESTIAPSPMQTPEQSGTDFPVAEGPGAALSSEIPGEAVPVSVLEDEGAEPVAAENGDGTLGQIGGHESEVSIADSSVEVPLSSYTGDLEIARQAIEAALLSATEPLTSQALRRLFDPDIGNDLMNRLLSDLQAAWQGRSAELMRLATGWRFQTRSDLQPYLDRLKETRAPRYSRAVLETLAVIVYRQPVTRGDVEDIRGVAVSSQIIKLLEARGWIDVIGHRDTPGRPALYATTKTFLDELGLRSLTELPPIAEIEGVLDLADTAEAASSTPAERSESPLQPRGEREQTEPEQSPDGTPSSEGGAEPA